MPDITFNGRYVLTRFVILICISQSLFQSCGTQQMDELRVSQVGKGWARNSINTVIFRKNSLTSNGNTQFIAYYDPEGYLVLGKRNHSEITWQTHKTQYKGNVRDAHNSISIEIDGAGYLHVSWDHHNTPLNYAKATSPGSLELGEKIEMIGQQENVVSYPEFYRLPNGDLLFFYRDGGSGNGNLVINTYQTAAGQWKRLQNNLIDGEGKRNAYWQACLDNKGIIHISWVWRESPDVASNHDIAYARSLDGGVSWQMSNGQPYTLPITQATAEKVHDIPMNSELINQTSMAVDSNGLPYIVSYWRPPGSEIPQYQLIYLSDGEWKVENTGFRKQAFSLSGMGTKQIPISRPQLVISATDRIYLIFRDAERNNKVSIAENQAPFDKEWSIMDYTDPGYNSWEPTYDPHRWTAHETLSLFLQKNLQVDGEGLSERESEDIEVLDVQLK